MGLQDQQSEFIRWYGNSEQKQIDEALFNEWSERVYERGEALGVHFDQSYQDRVNAAAARINAFNEYQNDQAQRARQDAETQRLTQELNQSVACVNEEAAKSNALQNFISSDDNNDAAVETTDADIQKQTWNVDLNLELDTAKPGANGGDRTAASIVELGQGNSLYNLVKNNPKFQAVADALAKSQSLDSELNWSYKFNWEPSPRVEVIIGGNNKVDCSAVSVVGNLFRGFQFGYYPPITDADKEAGYQYVTLLDGLTHVRARYGEDGTREIHRDDFQSYQDATNSFYRETALSAALPGATKVLSGSLSGLRKILSQESSKAAEALQNIKAKNVINQTAEEVNEWWKVEKGYTNPPYKAGTKVLEVELQETTSFVRVYDEVNSFQKGGWLMRKEDIVGLTAEQIKDKFALQYVPKYVVDVKVPAGTKIRIGEAGKIAEWGEGGGTQIDLLGKRAGEFINPRPLEGEWW